MPYRYIIKPLAVRNIRSFYRNVNKRYRHIYSYEDRLRYVNQTVDAIYSIEKTLHRRKPTLDRWQTYHMAHSGQWYYAYTISGDTIIIEDACHEQNMHN